MEKVIREMEMNLNKLGYNVYFESIIKTIKKPGRPHLGNALIKAGYFYES